MSVTVRLADELDVSRGDVIARPANQPHCSQDLEVNTLHRDEDATQLGLHDIGRVRLRATQPVHADACERNRWTGGLIFIDEDTDTTVGAGLLVDR